MKKIFLFLFLFLFSNICFAEISIDGKTIIDAGGSNTQIQYNDNNKLSGDSGIIFDKTNDKVTLLGADSIRLILQANATQSVSNPLLQFQDSSANPILNISTNGDTNIKIGVGAGVSQTTNDDIIAIGKNALYTASGASSVNSIAIGRQALELNNGSDSNLAIGHDAQAKITTGNSNCSVGNASLYNITTASKNVSFGRSGFLSLISGDSNTGIGASVCTNLEIGIENSVVGRLSLSNPKVASYNSVLGGDADYIGQPNAATAALAGLGAGNLSNGVYKYLVTFILDIGETSSKNTASVTVVDNTTNGQVALSSIPVYSGPFTCSARKIYRTNVNGPTATVGYKLLTTINDNSTTTYTDNTADGSLGAAYAGVTCSILLGYGAEALSSNQLVIGNTSSTLNITDVYLGQGIFDSNPESVTIHATGGSGTNNPGANLILAGGKSTGTEASGNIILQISGPGTTGSTYNALVNKASLSNTGLKLIAGTAVSQTANTSGTLKVDTTQTGNVGVGEDNLISFSMPANVMAVNGDTIEIVASGTFASNANNKRLKLYFGSTVLVDSTVLALNAGDWVIRANIIRTGAATQKAITTLASSNALLTHTVDFISPTEDLTSAVIVKCTGEAIDNNDIVQEELIIKYFPNN